MLVTRHSSALVADILWSSALGPISSKRNGSPSGVNPSQMPWPRVSPGCSASRAGPTGPGPW